jgi:hypothetical protein
VRVQQPRRHADYADTRCNGWGNASEPRESAGSVAETAGVCKMSDRRTTGIVRILCRTLRTFEACACQQKRLHQLFETLYVVAVRWKSVSAAWLIILWSSVQVTHALPFPYPKPLCYQQQSGFCFWMAL